GNELKGSHPFDFGPRVQKIRSSLCRQRLYGSKKPASLTTCLPGLSVYFPHPPAKIEAPPFGTKIKSLRLTSQRMEEAALVSNVTEFGDNALVSAYLEGNEAAFEVLMTRYQGRLANYINGILHDYDRSVELCQETFI